MTSTLFDTCKQAYDLVIQFLQQAHADARFQHSKNIVPEQYSPPGVPIPDFYNEKLHLATQAQVKHTFEVFREVLDIYRLEELSISYNGGKDCLVMLVIFLASIYDKYHKDSAELLYDNSIKINSVYINKELTFEEQNEFLSQSVDDYKLSFVEMREDMKKGFEKYLNMKPEIKAIIVGTRRIDPFGGNLHYLQITDHGWPQFMRVNPVLEWTYKEIWYFLKHCSIDYCKLYDEGFTSIGGVDNTIRNPLLLVNKERDVYLPAYMLEDDDKERLSRADPIKL